MVIALGKSLKKKLKCHSVIFWLIITIFKRNGDSYIGHLILESILLDENNYFYRLDPIQRSTG